MKWLKRLLCGHSNQEFVRNIYGDEINVLGGKRSIWVCIDCGKTIYDRTLAYKEDTGDAA